jgi:hypothetical protein
MALARTATRRRNHGAECRGGAQAGVAKLWLTYVGTKA